jgi:hypothetical protein
MLIVDKDGKVREVKGVLPDGAKLKVEMVMMDSVQRNIGGTPLVVDAYGNADLFALSRPGPRYPTQRTTADVMREVAYQDSEQAAQDAWRTGPPKPLPAGAYPSNGAKVGDICTINGAPGHLRDRDGGLVCVPDDDDTGDAMTGDARERAYAQRALEDENAWRGR